MKLAAFCSDVGARTILSERIEIEAGHGAAVRLDRGVRLRIISPEGPQVADTWAFAAEDVGEALSCEHTRSALERLVPRVGDALWSSRFRPMLTVVEDRSPGVHDLLVSACSPERYAAMGAPGHRSCAANLTTALAAAGVTLAGRQPSPFNVFERVMIGQDGRLAIQPPLAEPGDSLTLRAEMDLLLVVSACPMDLTFTNGADRRPKPIHLEVCPA
jgi:hypothetical protein